MEQRPRKSWWRRRGGWLTFGAGLVVACLSGAARGGEGATRDWTLKGPIDKPSAAETAAPRQLDAGINGEIGEICAVVGEVRVVRQSLEGQTRLERLQPGDKVMVGDQFDVGRASAVEMEFGLNARLRLGSESVLRVVGSQNGTADADGYHLRRDVRLAKGTARVRVKRNVLTPELVFLAAGDVALTLARTDTLVQQNAGGGGSILVLGGAADVQLAAGRSAGAGESVRIYRAQKLIVPGDLSNGLPRPQTMTAEEIANATGEFSFSIDQERQQLPPPPSGNREMDGP